MITDPYLNTLKYISDPHRTRQHVISCNLELLLRAILDSSHLDKLLWATLDVIVGPFTCNLLQFGVVVMGEQDAGAGG